MIGDRIKEMPMTLSDMTLPEKMAALTFVFLLIALFLFVRRKR
jgi:hypothetical protein